ASDQVTASPPDDQLPTPRRMRFGVGSVLFERWTLGCGSWLHSYDVNQLFHRCRRLLQRGLFFSRQRDLNDLLHTTRAQLHWHADEQISNPVFTLQEHRARQDLLLVLQN